MRLAIAATSRFAGHEPPPGHPESPARADVFDVVAGRARERGALALEAVEATDEQLLRVHGERYLERLAAVSGQAAMLDPDTFTSPESIAIARLAAGAGIAAVDALLDGRADSAAALVRPPGHHAEPDRAMGFCLLNNAAIAAAHARACGVARVAVVDFDVHHGNGTQAAFESDAHVLYVSTHQSPFYPGSGDVTECGAGDGVGFTVNVPMEAGCGDDDVLLVYREVVLPVLSAFAPSLVVMSAGYDAHERDPLAGMRMSTDGYARLTRMLVEAGAGARLLLVTEGGYDPAALAASLEASLMVMSGQPATVAAAEPAQASDRRGARAATRARGVLARYWRGL